MSDTSAQLAAGVGLLKAGCEIRVEWDAGNDSAVVYTFIDSERDPNQEKDFCEAVSDRIMIDLNLPWAGDHMHEGGGQILLDDQDRMVLRFTSEDVLVNYHFYFDEDELRLTPDTETVGRELLQCNGWQDPGGVEPLLRRAELRLVGIMDREFESREIVKLAIIDGDEVELDEATMSYYRGRIREALERAHELCADRIAAEDVVAVYIEGVTRNVNCAEFFVELDAFLNFRLHRNDTLILWDGAAS